MNTDHSLPTTVSALEYTPARYEQYKQYLAEIGQCTGIPRECPWTESEFRQLWEGMSLEQRERFAATLDRGFLKSAEESWPQTQAVLRAFEAGERDPEISAWLDRIYGSKGA
jgi:hypothetical protein